MAGDLSGQARAVARSLEQYYVTESLTYIYTEKLKSRVRYSSKEKVQIVYREPVTSNKSYKTNRNS